MDKVVLPRGPWAYLSAPGETGSKVRLWLNARWQLRACNRLGRWVRLDGRVYVRNHGEIILGDHVLFHACFAPSVLLTLRGGRLQIGDRTFLNYGLDITATKLVKIGA